MGMASHVKNSSLSLCHGFSLMLEPNVTVEDVILAVPTFIPDGELMRELACYGKFAMRELLLGCKNPLLKHVTACRMQVFMFLDSQTKTFDISYW